ncbi:hypothetical protein BH23PLA1_BH23PLA1_00960 [soil metagenome]
MSPDLIKLVPPLVVLTGTGLCLWPYLEVELPRPAVTASTLKFNPETLDPVVGPASPRDPFRLASEPMPPVTPVAVRESAGTLAESRSTAAPAPPRPRSPVGLGLQATLIGRGRRSAIINDRIYDQRAIIDTEGKHSGPWELVWIDRDRVILIDEAGAQRVTLSINRLTDWKNDAHPSEAERPATEEINELLSMIGVGGGPDSALSLLWRILKPTLLTKAIDKH